MALRVPRRPEYKRGEHHEVIGCRSFYFNHTAPFNTPLPLQLYLHSFLLHNKPRQTSVYLSDRHYGRFEHQAQVPWRRRGRRPYRTVSTSLSEASEAVS